MSRSASAALVPPSYLLDGLRGGLARDVAIVGAGAMLTGMAAQVAVPLPFTPVPFTLQTLAVLVIAAAAGPLRGAASMAVYAALGAGGIPWFAGGGSGPGGAVFGYVVGFVVAAVVVGALGSSRFTRSGLGAAGVMILGTLVIYAVGVPWLAAATGTSIGAAVAMGLLPFLLGDLVKVAAATALLPSAWHLVGGRCPDGGHRP